MALSVVIPTWNEEHWLPRLLDQLSDRVEIDEIVVADNGSTDRTREIAGSFGCRVVQGGRPAEGRNRGAAAATGDRLLFIDADAVPTVAAMRRLSRPAGDGAVCFRVFPISEKAFVRACYATADAWFVALGAVGVCHGFTNFLLVTRQAFESVGGFDEGLDPGEDVDFVRRVGRIALVEYDRAAPVFISARRFLVEPAGVFAAKTVFWEALRLLEIRRNPLRYRWLRHDPAFAACEAAWLSRRGLTTP